MQADTISAQSIIKIVENNRVLLAFSKILDILGEQSRNTIIGYIQNKYGTSPFSSPTHSMTLEEVEDAIVEVLPIGSSLVIKMLRAELDVIE